MTTNTGSKMENASLAEQKGRSSEATVAITKNPEKPNPPGRPADQSISKSAVPAKIEPNPVAQSPSKTDSPNPSPPSKPQLVSPAPPQQDQSKPSTGIVPAVATKPPPPLGKPVEKLTVAAPKQDIVPSNAPAQASHPTVAEFFPDSSAFPDGLIVAKRRWSLWVSLILLVFIPVFLSIIYFGVLASDQYVSTSQFIIHTRSLIPSGPTAIPGAGMTVVSPLAISDMLVVQDYVGSRQILDDISGEVDIRTIYSPQTADWFARLKPLPHLRRLINGEVFSKGLSGRISEEDLLSYWRKMVSVKFDMTTGIATLKVKAFSAEDALRIAQVVLDRSERLVNQLSERSLEDSLKFAKAEVAEAQSRAISALDGLQTFQAEVKEVDPAGYAAARGTIQAKLDADLSLYQSQLELLRKTLPENAPGIRQLKTKILVIQNQIQAERIKSTSNGDVVSASEVLNEFAKKKLDVDFGTQAYVSALGYLESARITAMQQSRYLEAFVRPQLPDEAEYPRRLNAVLLMILATSILWGVGYLLISAAREHL